MSCETFSLYTGVLHTYLPITAMSIVYSLSELLRKRVRLFSLLFLRLFWMEPEVFLFVSSAKKGGHPLLQENLVSFHVVYPPLLSILHFYSLVYFLLLKRTSGCRQIFSQCRTVCNSTYAHRGYGSAVWFKGNRIRIDRPFRVQGCITGNRISVKIPRRVERCVLIPPAEGMPVFGHHGRSGNLSAMRCGNRSGRGRPAV